MEKGSPNYTHAMTHDTCSSSSNPPCNSDRLTCRIYCAERWTTTTTSTTSPRRRLWRCSSASARLSRRPRPGALLAPPRRHRLGRRLQFGSQMCLFRCSHVSFVPALSVRFCYCFPVWCVTRRRQSTNMELPSKLIPGSKSVAGTCTMSMETNICRSRSTCPT